MGNKHHEVTAWRNTGEIDKGIKDILSRGDIVKFHNIFNGKIKYVKEWNQDEDGDLTAFKAPGCITKFVCP